MPYDKVEAITLFVDDPQESKRFYARVFEVAPIYEDANSAAFRFQGIIVNLLAMPAAHELIGPATVASAMAGSRFQITVMVDDVDGFCERLAAAGVPLINGPMDRPWGLRTAAFADPDGHIWEAAAPLPRDTAP